MKLAEKKENILPSLNNRNGSFGKLNLPKISPSFPNMLANKTNIQHNMNKKALGLKLPIPNKKEQRKTINFNILKTDIELVKNLDIDLGPDQIISREFDSHKIKEQIDSNEDIKMKRLGKYKNKYRDDSTNDIEARQRVKFLEKEFQNDLNEYNAIKKENEQIDEHISNLINIIDDYKLELYALNKYSNELYKKFLENEENKKEEIIKKIENNIYKDQEEYESLHQELKTFNFDKKAKFQNEVIMKVDSIKENLNRTKELLQELQDKKKNMKLESKEAKNKINENRRKLIKLYHVSLYEGLDFRYEGLSNLIRAIWNLGVDVDMKFMPRYLDDLLIDFLFEHAKKYIEINNFKKQIEISQEKFYKNLSEWKAFNNFNFKNENSSMSSNSDVNLFQTRLNNKGKYPKSRKFMKEYYNKYSHLIDHKEVDVLKEYKQSLSDKRNILPKNLVEERKTIEKGKYILQNLQMKMKDFERNEIKRVCREFVLNNYGNVFEVCPYIIVSAICGDESKEEGMMFFNKIEKEIVENRKKISFFQIKKK